MAISTDREFNRYSISAADFEMATRFAKAAQNHLLSFVEYESLLFAAIVSYIRPFSSNEMNTGTSAEARVTLKSLEVLSESELALHEQCVFLRNKALAHSESALNPTRLLAEIGVVKSRPFSLLTPSFDVQELLALAEK
jgi:hypothetical protein